MKLLLPAFTAAIVGIAGAALAQTGTQTVKLNAQNQSGESGNVTITPQGNGTQVVIQLNGAPAAAQPAHIHAGSCANLDPKPKIALQNVVNGTSTTLLDMPMRDVMSGAINVHKSTDDINTYVACGDLKPSN